MPRPQRQDDRRTLIAVPIETPAGVFIASFSARGLAQLSFPRRYAKPGPPDPARLTPELREWMALAQKSVLAALEGRTPAQLPPLDLSAGTEFQQRVWTVLRGLATGQTKSYGQIARELGSPRAARAVGAACGTNPIPLLIPCHRVLAAGDELGGFSGGLDWKLRLLAAEGVELTDAPSS